MNDSMYRRRFVLVYLGLVLILAASGYGAFRGVDAHASARARAKATCTAPQVGADPMLTAVSFIHTTVERANPGAGFALATPALRSGTTCSDWVHGRVPVKEFRQVDWERAQYQVEDVGGTQMSMKVLLASKVGLQPGLFLLELRRIGERWRVGYWGPADIAA